MSKVTYNIGKTQCIKQLVKAVLVTEAGEIFVGTNYINNNSIKACPRSDMKSGEGYHLCNDICDQSAHAEVNAIKAAGLKSKGSTIYVEGHTYACNSCLAAANEAGVKNVIIGKYEGLLDLELV